jgi:hypothetical protein
MIDAANETDGPLTPDNGCQHGDSAKMADAQAPESVATTPVIPAKRGRGAPANNRNALKSGVRSFILGRFPTGGSWVARQCHWLRRELRRDVTARDGSTSTYSEAVICSAIVHEGRRLLLARWLRLEGDKLPVSERANLLDRIGKASDARDACLEKLGLHRRLDAGNDPLACLDALCAESAPELMPKPANSPEMILVCSGMTSERGDA